MSKQPTAKITIQVPAKIKAEICKRAGVSVSCRGGRGTNGPTLTKWFWALLERELGLDDKIFLPQGFASMPSKKVRQLAIRGRRERTRLSKEKKS